MQSHYDVIKRPLISEKAAALTEVAGRYVFEVHPRATKHEIRDAVEKIYNVKVSKVRTMNMHGKLKVVGPRLVKRPGWKKAIISVPEGQKIELFQG